MKVIGVVFGLFLSIGLANAQQGDVLIASDVTKLEAGDIADVMLKSEAELRADLLSSAQRFRRVVDATYLTEAAAAEAVEQGLDKEPEVRARIERATQDILAGARVEWLVRKELKEADLDAAAKEYYAAHPEEFRQERTMHSAHILLKESDEAELSAKERAEELLARINAGELAFAEAAKEYSADPGSASKGGELGWRKKGDFVGPFGEALFAIGEDGAIAGPVETEFGFHLIQRIGARGGEIKDFDSVAQSIKDRLKTRLAKNIREEYFIGLRDDPNVTVHPERIQEAYVRERKKWLED